MFRSAARTALCCLLLAGAVVASGSGFGAAGAGVARAEAPTSPRTPALLQPSYLDVDDDGVHSPAVNALAGLGTFDGTECGPRRFCPTEPLKRSTMAVWLVRILDGADPTTAPDAGFVDVAEDAWWAPHVNRLAELGVTKGCRSDPPRFCPDRAVNRAQMASFLARAFALEPGPPAGFADVGSDSVHNDNIDALAAAGVTVGCRTGPPRYCPQRSTTRAQMATFLHRAIAQRPRSPSVRIDSSTPSVVVGGFDVSITFDTPVTGFDHDDVVVVNGSVENLTGDGASYTAVVVPAADGTVIVRVPGSVATAANGRTNTPSSLLVRTPARSSDDPPPGIDTWDRRTVLDAYRDEFEREEPDWGFDGDVDNCIAGTTSQDFRDSVLQRVNWYRRMAGLPVVTEDPELTATAQQKALIMLAQQGLAHYPPADWACYTEIEFPGENLALGAAGVLSVDGYMQDSGDHNLAVGHRQQILSPFVARIGTGDVVDRSRFFGAANAMHLAYDRDLDAAVREERGFVAWPAPGYVPAQTVWGRWSFSRQRFATETTREGNVTRTRWFLSRPDFSEAAVAMSDDDGAVPVRIIHHDDALVWAVDGDTRSDQFPQPTDGDHCYTVTVSGVLVEGVIQTPYEYAVCVLDPDS